MDEEKYNDKRKSSSSDIGIISVKRTKLVGDELDSTIESVFELSKEVCDYIKLNLFSKLHDLLCQKMWDVDEPIKTLNSLSKILIILYPYINTKKIRNCLINHICDQMLYIISLISRVPIKLENIKNEEDDDLLDSLINVTSSAVNICEDYMINLLNAIHDYLVNRTIQIKNLESIIYCNQIVQILIKSMSYSNHQDIKLCIIIHLSSLLTSISSEMLNDQSIYYKKDLIKDKELIKEREKEK